MTRPRLHDRRSVERQRHLNTYSEEFDKAMHRDDLFARIEKAAFGSV